MTTWTQSNFNGGEWSPLMYGRFQLDKYKTSVARMLNFIPQIQGGITRRSGTRYVREVKASENFTRVVRFEFNVTQAYALEFGDHYIRFFANDGEVLDGGVPYEVATGYFATELGALNFVQSADVLYIFHPDHPPAKLQRFGATNWTLVDCAFQDGPYLPLNITPTTLTINAFTGDAVLVTASSTAGINNGGGFSATDIGRPLRVKNAGAWGWGTITAVNDALSVIVRVVNPFGGQPAGASAPVLSDSGGSIRSIAVAAGGAGYAVAPGVSISSPGGSGIPAQAQAIVDKGVVTALLVTYPGVGYGGPPGVYIAGPPSVAAPFTTTNWRIGVWSKTTGFPTVGTFHEDRLFLGGCRSYPQRLDGSNTSDYENMAPTEIDATVLASNAVGFTLNANSVNSINWMLSDEKGLQAGGASAEWLVRADTTQQALSPTNVQAKPSTFYGSAVVQPIKAGRRALFVQRGARKVRQSSYSIQDDGFSATDVSLVSEHLTATGIVEMALQRVPQQIVWMCRGDGALIGLTYEYEQDVIGFHGHAIAGFLDDAKTQPARVESICAIPNSDGTRDELWMVVRRSINGVQRRYVEVMSKLWESGDDLASTSYLDCSAEYRGAPATTVSGLGYLEGQTVSVLADGATHPDRVVTAGAITLNRASSVVQVGLAYNSDLLTHRMEVQTPGGSGQMRYGRITEAAMRVTDSSAMQYGPNFDTLETMASRSSAVDMDGPPPLIQGDIVQLRIEDAFETYNQLAIRQGQPLPLNIQMLTAECKKAA